MDNMTNTRLKESRGESIATFYRRFTILCLVFGLYIATVTLAYGQSSTTVPTDTVIVFDGSGSMWARVDGGESGPTKIEVARKTLLDVIGELDDDMRLGLVAYGHRSQRREQNCSDIETLVPVGPARSTVPDILSAARSIEPKGMTPLTDAVRVAAEGMRYTERPATVVLITDGIESCNGDPCALANELERFGIDFTAHVVGFGLDPIERAQVQCLADGTGGQYFEAADAAGLQTALADALLPLDDLIPPQTKPERTIPNEIALFFYADPAKTRQLGAGVNGFDYARIYRTNDLEGWDLEMGFPDVPEVATGSPGLVHHPSTGKAPNQTIRAPEAGDYTIVSRFSGIDKPTFARNDFTVEPGMDWVVEMAARIAYVEPEMITEDGQRLITGGGSIRDAGTGERLSYGYTSRRYYPIVEGERGDRSSVDGKFGPIPAGEYEMVLQVGGAAHIERIAIAPGEDYRPRVTLAPIVTARVEVIDDRGRDLNDGYKTYIQTCSVQPRDTEDELTGCSDWGNSSITQKPGATFFRPGPQVVVFESDFRNVRAESVVSIPLNATADTFTITMSAGQTADTTNGRVDIDTLKAGTGADDPSDTAQSTERPTDNSIDASLIPVPDGLSGNGVQDDETDVRRSTSLGPPAPPSFNTAPVPPSFGSVATPPVLPGRVFLRIYAGSIGGTLLNDSAYRRRLNAGEYLGTWVYRAEDLVTPDASTRPILSDRDTAPEAIPTEFGGDDASGPAAYPTIATKSPMSEGDYVAVSSFIADDVRVNVQTPFSISLGTKPIIDLVLGKVSEQSEPEASSNSINDTISMGGADPQKMLAPVAEPTPLSLDELVNADELGSSANRTSDAPTGLANPTVEPEQLASSEDGSMANVFVKILGLDNSLVLTPFQVVLCEDKPRDSAGLLRGCGQELEGHEAIAIPTGISIVIGAWDEESFGASKVFTVPESAAGKTIELILTSTEKALSVE